MPNTNTTNNKQENNTETPNTENTPNTSSGCVYDKYGRTPDKSQICAIGIKSAGADTQDGVVKCVFKNECPHCHNNSLMWGWKWENDPEKVAKFEGTDGTNEGHIYCVMSEGGCDADYSIEGNEHIKFCDLGNLIVDNSGSINQIEFYNGYLFVACDRKILYIYSV